MYHVLILLKNIVLPSFVKVIIICHRFGKSLPSNEEKYGKEMCDTLLNYHKKENKKSSKFPSFRNHTHLHVLIKLIIIPFEIEQVRSINVFYYVDFKFK
jgi:hypothetical protein